MSNFARAQARMDRVLERTYGDLVVYAPASGLTEQVRMSISEMPDQDEIANGQHLLGFVRAGVLETTPAKNDVVWIDDETANPIEYLVIDVSLEKEGSARLILQKVVS